MGVTKVTLVTHPSQLPKEEAGPISIIMGANLRKQETKAPSKSSDKTKETEMKTKQKVFLKNLVVLLQLPMF